jgi:predicted RNase H-like HicB family nuclease
MSKREKRLAKLRQNPNDYLTLPYQLMITPDDEGFGVEVVELPGCVTHAEHWEEIPHRVREALTSWIGSALQHEETVPEPVLQKA